MEFTSQNNAPLLVGVALALTLGIALHTAASAVPAAGSTSVGPLYNCEPNACQGTFYGANYNLMNTVTGSPHLLCRWSAVHRGTL